MGFQRLYKISRRGKGLELRSRNKYRLGRYFSPFAKKLIEECSDTKERLELKISHHLEGRK